MKLITWNVQWFCGLDDVVSVERIVGEVRAMADFDVLCLQEVAVNYPQLTGNAGFDQVARLRELLPDFEVFFGAAVNELGRNGQRQQFGNLVATRLPVAQVQYYPLPYPADGGVRSMPRMCTCLTVLTQMRPLRVMTTHLEFYSTRQRLAQAQSLVDIHAQACSQAAHPPLIDETGAPFQRKVHTQSAVLCGDFNFETSDTEYARIQVEATPGTTRLTDAWRLVHGNTPHAPTFRLVDRRYGPEPICCDFVFVSDDLKSRVTGIDVNTQTRASDHQPVLLELD
ncbi:MAG: endonuclease/exonuclease/phosphatase family protein [Polaromonas sp.]|uniref:endonuclease/exonuclease/phosphatase family protein n=1 Tax=Polaromonas sp. TaxID=1869339 RepID=UPI002735D0D6|nr:endonuclease/exonuclease/phosphatase family protein [Polaromonas sp.]MDP2820309.1 endonuclease/exonuclease/phosphatase family protein [Polaromonas sp.]